MLAQQITGCGGCLVNDSELDLAIARSCWGGSRAGALIAGGVSLDDLQTETEFTDPALAPSENFASPVCDAKGGDKDPEAEEEEEDGDEFEDDDEDDEDEEFEGDDEFEDDEDELFDGDDDDDEFDDDMDDEDDEDEDF